MLQSELSGKQAAAARNARLETTHSLRGADGGPVLFSSGIIAEALRQAAAEQAELGMSALALGEAGEGQVPGPEQVPEASARGSERSSRKAPSQR